MSLAAPVSGPNIGPTATDTRAALVTALSAVPGLTAYPSAPDVGTAGAAWPRWTESRYHGGLAMPAQHTWEIYVTLPAGYAPAAVSAADELVAEVVAALWPVGAVDRAEPVTLVFDDKTAMPAFRVRMTAPK